ncbi:MAG: hypothetical protein JNL24_07000 [Bacteroidia bacterium]|nr:hypothetical protein [Bacteroidia bacterium]
MKTYIFLFSTLAFFSCSAPSNKQEQANTDTTGLTSQPATNNTYPSRVFAQGILDNTIQPSDNNETFACLDSLDDDNADTRQFYFQVYRVIAQKSDGALSEVVGSYTKSYMQLFPQEALNYYKTFDDKEKNLFIDNLAYEFYASGSDYEQDIQNYFSEIENICKDCLSDNIMLDIKKQITAKAAAMNQ